jgi:hypothetical protein
MESLVDDDVYDWLSKYRWQVSGGYARRNNGTHTLYLHRIIAGIPHSFRVRHKDRNPLNNQRHNLSTPIPNWTGSNQSSQFRGVEWDHKKCLWRASICDLIIGHYDNEIDAAIAWNDKIYELGITTEINDMGFLNG